MKEHTPTTGAKMRPPIVVVMGHVDHGKTTLLDHIRKTEVAEREAGGITQSIGAYEIIHKVANPSTVSGRLTETVERKMTFIDTPGHEAFTKMRTRGAHAADLAILVVAADEGVKPQTKESVRIIEETKTPYVVAITKTDKPGADIEKVKNDLTANGVLLEGYGGAVSYEAVSAKTGEGVSELLDLLLVAAELEELTYDPALPASGYILETRVDKQRGLEATVIVKNGTLRFGDTIATPSAKGKIKILENFLEENARELSPSAPALIIGFEKLPQVGEEFVTGANADALAMPADVRVGPTAVSAKDDALNVSIKAGDAGSLEALTEIVRAMALPKPIRIVQSSVGDVTDNDVKFAVSAKAIVLAFKNKTDKAARTLAEANRVRIVSSEIIYELIRSVEEATKEIASGVLGVLEVLAVFNQKKLEKQVVGGKIVQGVCRNRTQFHIERASVEAGQGSVSVGTGRVTNLQTGKVEVHEVGEGKEAGLLVSANVAIAVGDKLVFTAKSE